MDSFRNGGKILTAMENRKRRGKEEKLWRRCSKIARVLFASVYIQVDIRVRIFGYLILSYDEFGLRIPYLGIGRIEPCRDEPMMLTLFGSTNGSIWASTVDRTTGRIILGNATDQLLPRTMHQPCAYNKQLGQFQFANLSCPQVACERHVIAIPKRR